jgi:hypothetical protein
MGSKDPVTCTNCGVLIRKLDLSGAMVIPPVWGVVVINDINQEELDAVSRVIEDELRGCRPDIVICFEGKPE